MRKVVVTQFLTLDGVMEAPQEWSFPYWNDETEVFKNAELAASDAQLLGRVTYEAFAAAWPSRTGYMADRLNSLPKFVVSTTLERAEWNNSHLIKEDVAEQISSLKQQPGHDILVHGSRTLVQTLIRDGLVDEYHLLVYPLVLGSGIRLFSDGGDTKLRMVESKTFATGVVALTYEPVRG